MSILNFDEVAPILEAVGIAEAKGEPFDFEQTSRDLGVTKEALQATCEAIESAWLMIAPPDEPGARAILTHAGKQYLALHGHVDEDTLFFLPEVIGDLHAREALIRAGAVLVDEFRKALLEERGVGHAAELIPAAFAAAVDERLALDLFAATVALMARLSSGEAAGCLAEEIVAVALLDEARGILDVRQEAGEIGAADATAAKATLQTLFDLFGDSDVLSMFEMEEPADAALAGHSPVNRQMGSADQRLEAWFEPFGTVAPTGYLSTQLPPQR